MSNDRMNEEQNQLIEQTPTQANPGAAMPTDFKVNESLPGHGQCGDSEREYNALLAGAHGLEEPIPERNEVPRR